MIKSPLLLVDKYRPSRVQDLVLPAKHNLHKVIEWCQDPYPSAWLFHGPSGLGKTSLARIMASIASPSEFGRQSYVGPDLDGNKVRHLAPTLTQRPVFGGMHAILINEADAIPEVGQIRLLDLLESHPKTTALIVATANADLDHYESRLTSRFQCVHWTKEGLLTPATDWLLRIADCESIALTRKAAERMVVDSRTNLRAALQALDSYAARLRVGPQLPVLKTLGETRANGVRIEAVGDSTGLILPARNLPL
jgi:replication-associated recombination protein RarA